MLAPHRLRHFRILEPVGQYWFFAWGRESCEGYGHRPSELVHWGDQPA